MTKLVYTLIADHAHGPLGHDIHVHTDKSRGQMTNKYNMEHKINIQKA